jgi:Gas vesicle synthesis protein GvpL/GvpF
MNGTAGRASYAYAVARSFDPAQLAGVRGVDGAEVRLVPYRDLVAVVSPVPRTEFDEAALRTKLESPPAASPSRCGWQRSTAGTSGSPRPCGRAIGGSAPRSTGWPDGWSWA